MTRKEARYHMLQRQTAALNYVVHRLLTAMPLPTSPVITKRERRALVRAIGDMHKRAERLNARRKAAA